MRRIALTGMARTATVMTGAAATFVLASGIAWAAPSATGTPSAGLKDGSKVAISGTGFGSGTTVYIVECSSVTDPNGCDTKNLGSATSDASGNISATFTVHTGAVGNGTCAAGSSSCSIAMSDLAKQYPAYFGISFAKPAAPKPTTSASPKPGVTAKPTGATVAPS